MNSAARAAKGLSLSSTSKCLLGLTIKATPWLPNSSLRAQTGPQIPQKKLEEKQRLLAGAKKEHASEVDVPTKRPHVPGAGLNPVTTTVENKKA